MARFTPFRRRQAVDGGVASGRDRPGTVGDDQYLEVDSAAPVPLVDSRDAASRREPVARVPEVEVRHVA
jgi:hypothetical protein